MDPLQADCASGRAAAEAAVSLAKGEPIKANGEVKIGTRACACDLFSSGGGDEKTTSKKPSSKMDSESQRDQRRSAQKKVGVYRNSCCEWHVEGRGQKTGANPFD